MTSHRQLLSAAAQSLAAVTDQSQFEAEMLLALVLDKPRSYLRLFENLEVSVEDIDRFNSLLHRRKQNEPMAYLTGHREFWSLDLIVTPATLIPRSETELLVELVLQIFPDKKGCIKLADLGTGSGAIALAVASERPEWLVIATDASESALQIARLNAQRLVLNHISFFCGNWCTALPHNEFDVIVSNPPYLQTSDWPVYGEGLKFEPPAALISGKNGLDDIYAIISCAKKYLKSGGFVLIEHGFMQAKPVQDHFAAEGYQNIETFLDLAGHQRVTKGRYFI